MFCKCKILSIFFAGNPLELLRKASSASVNWRIKLSIQWSIFLTNVVQKSLFLFKPKYFNIFRILSKPLSLMIVHDYNDDDDADGDDGDDDGDFWRECSNKARCWWKGQSPHCAVNDENMVEIVMEINI